MVNLTWLFVLVIAAEQEPDQILLPIRANDRSSVSAMTLTEIGKFGLLRKARPTVPQHFHTGIDIRRPNDNYAAEPLFAICPGKVISKRTDGAFAQLILEHHRGSETFWTVYEHIAGIQVQVGQEVDTKQPLARFMNRVELDRHGWQFDHVHFEILRIRPTALPRKMAYPDRLYNSYSLVCRTPEELEMYFFNPIQFLQRYLR